MKMTTVTPMSAKLIGAERELGRAQLRLASTTRYLPSGWAHSGHFCPTAESTLHSTQIGFPQFAQESRVSRLGCR
jgi:hypothetical protein